MAVLKNRADGGRKLLVALAALIQTGADLFFLVGFNFPDGFCIGIFAMRADRAVRPVNRFPILAGGFIGGKSLHDLVKRQIIWRW